MNAKGKKILIVGIVLTFVLGMVAVAGCAPKRPPSSAAVETTAAQAVSEDGAIVNATTEYAEMFPLEYNSLQQTRINAKGKKIGHGVVELREVCEAPLLRDVNGAIIDNEDGSHLSLGFEYNTATGKWEYPELTDEQLAEVNLKTGCLSCKTSLFTTLYEKHGAEAYGKVYNAEDKAIVNSDYFDCQMCHDGAPSAKTLSANMIYFKALGEGFAEDLPTKLAVCGQCHNSYDFRSRIKTEEDLETFKPYRYGYDMDALFEANYEDGTNFATDEETGISESYIVHPHVELFMGTKMQEEGVTCVDCHMPKAEADGKEYTNHFAANSPLENEDALNYCLTCHKDQGQSTIDDMKAFVQERKDVYIEGQEGLEKNIADFKKALTDAVKAKGKDDTSLDEAKKLYAKATWYDRLLITGDWESSGSMVAMMDWEAAIEKGNKACEDGMKALK